MLEMHPYELLCMDGEDGKISPGLRCALLGAWQRHCLHLYKFLFRPRLAGCIGNTCGFRNVEGRIRHLQ